MNYNLSQAVFEQLKQIARNPPCDAYVRVDIPILHNNYGVYCAVPTTFLWERLSKAINNAPHGLQREYEITIATEDCKFGKEIYLKIRVDRAGEKTSFRLC